VYARTRSRIANRTPHSRALFSSFFYPTSSNSCLFLSFHTPCTLLLTEKSRKPSGISTLRTLSKTTEGCIGISDQKPFLRLSLLESALPQNVPVTLLESALTNLKDLKPFRIRTYKKRGEGGKLLTRNPKKDFYPDGASRPRDLSYYPMVEGCLSRATNGSRGICFSSAHHACPEIRHRASSPAVSNRGGTW
jgi:hypothetical protein